MTEKIAYIFPGQGAQQVGMGQDVYQACNDARSVFDRASELTGMDLASICFNGPAEVLNATDVSQVAIFTTSLALLKAGQAAGALADDGLAAAGGLSLGEYTALCVAGVLDFEQAVSLVQKRGRYMQEAAEANPGTMVALRGADEPTAEDLCRQAAQGDVLSPANYNCPGQIVASGTKAACSRLMQLAQQRGIPGVELTVAGAFHSKLMSPASRRLAQALAEVKLNEPKFPVACNVTGEYYTGSEEIRRRLPQQVDNPIRWQKCVETMVGQGIEKYYEIGPGKVLAGLARRINRKVKVTNINTKDSLDKA